MSQTKLSELGQKIFDQRYSYPGERGYSDRCKAMAKHVAAAEKEEDKKAYEDKFYEALNSGDFIPGGRIIYGSGRNKQNLLNCYAIEPEDTVESIGKCISDMYRISCGGGGIGFNFSKIRPRGDDIGNVRNSAPGAVSTMKMINEIGNHVKSGKNRRTALMAELNVDHPDLLEFLHVKLDLSQLTNFNISVAITDEFIKACEDGASWTFKFGNKDYYVYSADRVSPNGTKSTINIIALNAEDAISRAKNHMLNHPDDKFENVDKVDLKAMDLWDKIWKNAVESGDPGIFNLSLVNSHTNLSYFLKMNQSNPCHSGSSYLLTSKGYKTFKDLFDSGEKVLVVQDSRVEYSGPEKDDNNPSYWTVNSSAPSHVVNQASEVFLTKKNTDVVKVVTNSGLEMVLTPDHHVATKDRGMVEAKDLRTTDSVLVAKTAIRSATTNILNHYNIGYLYGLFVGDGHYNTDHNCVALQFWNSDKEEVTNVLKIINELYSLDEFERLHEWSPSNQSRKISPYYTLPETRRNSLLVHSTFLLRLFNHLGLTPSTRKYYIPDHLLNDNNFFAGFMSGMVFTDGTINSGKNKQFSVRIGSVEKDFLLTLQRTLLEFGEFTKVYLRKNACSKLMPNGSGGLSFYECKDFYELVFDSSSRSLFNDNFISLRGSKRLKFDKILKDFSISSRGPNWYTKVKSVTPFGTEDVYCLSENNRRTIVVNGITNRRCGEIPLESYANCCLGHVNLSNMLNQDNSDVDWRKLARTIRVGIRFLDNVLTVNHYPIPECKVSGERSRRIGLGTLGLHHMLIKLGIRYGSDKCLEFLERLYATIRDEAYLASMYISRDKGPFPEFDAKKFLDEGFAKTLPARIRMLIKDHGIRNGVMLTAAPTGTISMVHSTSTGIEPIFAPMYKRRYREGNTWRETVVLDPLFKEALMSGGDTTHIVGAYDITPEQHMAVQAVCQRYIDNAVSKTINLPNDAKHEDISKLALKFAPYLKGTTIYRAGSKGEEPMIAMPLTPENLELARKTLEAEVGVDACRIGGECGS